MVIKTNAEKFIKKIIIRVKNFKNDDKVKVKVLFGLILPKDVRCISTFILLCKSTSFRASVNHFV